MSRHEEYMKQAAAQSDALEHAGKRPWGSVDMVNSPPHYNQRGTECIDAIEAATGDGYEYYLQGNIMKYVWRYRYKNGTEDRVKESVHDNEIFTLIFTDAEMTWPWNHPSDQTEKAERTTDKEISEEAPYNRTSSWTTTSNNEDLKKQFVNEIKI